MSDRVRVFVYGTLKEGHGNNTLMRRCQAEFIGRDYITKGVDGTPLAMVSLGGFPAVCWNPGGPTVPILGEVWEMDFKNLESVDALENHPRWYKREKLTTHIMRTRAWIYCMPQSVLTRRAEHVIEPACWRPKANEADFWREEGFIGAA